MLRAKSALRYIPAITAISADLADLLEQHMDPRGTVPDVTALLYRWALESIGAIFLDARLGCLAPRLAGESRARGMIDCADVLLGQTMQELLFGVPLWKVYPTANYRKFNQASENLYRYGEFVNKLPWKNVHLFLPKYITNRSKFSFLMNH